MRLIPLALFAIAQSEAYIEGVPKRGALPGVLDIGNHQGNVNNSLLIGAVAGNLLMRRVEHAKKMNPLVRRAVVTGGAAFVGATLNAFVEYRVGQSFIGPGLFDIFGEFTTPDPVDVVYGTAAAAGASLAIVPHENIEPNTAQQAIPTPEYSYSS